MAFSSDSPPQIPSVPPSHTRSSFKIQIWEWKRRILVTDMLLWGSYSLCLTLQCGSTDEDNPETPSVRLPPSPPVALTVPQDQQPLWEEGGMSPGLSLPAHDSLAALI